MPLRVGGQTPQTPLRPVASSALGSRPVAWTSLPFPQGVPASRELPCSTAHILHRVGLEDLSGARTSLKTESPGHVAFFLLFRVVPCCPVGLFFPVSGLGPVGL